MKTFLVIFSIVLLAFGASILYYRSGSGKPNSPSSSNSTTSGKPATSNPVASVPSQNSGQSAADVLSETTGPAPSVKLLSLEIRQSQTGILNVGKQRVYTGVAKDETGAVVTVGVAWSLSNVSLGTLSTTQGSETVLTAKKVGVGKMLASFENLKAERDLEVGALTGPVLGSATTNPPSQIDSAVQAVPNPKPVELRIYDTSGRRFNVNESRTYNGRVLYSDNTERKVETITWSVDPSDLGSLNSATGTDVTFTAKRTGTGSLKASFENLSTSVYLLVN